MAGIRRMWWGRVRTNSASLCSNVLYMFLIMFGFRKVPVDSISWRVLLQKNIFIRQRLERFSVRMTGWVVERHVWDIVVITSRRIRNVLVVYGVLLGKVVMKEGPVFVMDWKVLVFAFTVRARWELGAGVQPVNMGS